MALVVRRSKFPFHLYYFYYIKIFSLVLCTNFSFPLIQTKRYRGKINLRRPQKPHFERALVLTLTKPKFESKLKGKTRLELCSFNETKNQEIDNPYERIIAADILDYFKSSKLILFCHKNPIVGEEEAQAKRLFLKNNMQMEVFGKKTMKMALEGTPYEAVLSLIVSHNALVFSPEINIKKSLQIFKKFPSFVVLGNN